MIMKLAACFNLGRATRTALLTLLTCSLFGSAMSSALAAPRKVLVVTVTLGFRHSSIPTAEKVLAELGKDSKSFQVDYARVEPSDPQFLGADGKTDNKKVNEAIKKVLAEKMNAKALKQYKTIIFANTTGDLPLPDKEAFLKWIRAGNGFVGMHAAGDTFHGYPAYLDMIGGEFRQHGPQVEVQAINQDWQCPACAHLGSTWTVFDEIYQFKNFDPTKVHGLLTLDKHPNDKTPGNYPVSWCKSYGKGRVFYTSLGHREDMWDVNTPPDYKRINSKEIALAYQKHILGGIQWAMGLTKWHPAPLSSQP
jgi:uncharacterized protein